MPSFQGLLEFQNLSSDFICGLNATVYKRNCFNEDCMPSGLNRPHRKAYPANHARK